MIKRKICVVTGSRAEFGLLFWVLKELLDDKDIKLQLVVTGMHLSKEFGYTYKEIEKDFKIDSKINMQLFSDTSEGISSSMGIAQKLFSKVYKKLKPDIILVLGDRYEIFSAVCAAMIAKVPIAHIHGGEITEGSWDDNIRHCITKIAHLHFTATDEYRNRVIQLGEQPNRVFNFGGLGVENIKKLKLLNKKDFERSIQFKLNKKNLLITFHPATLENVSPKKQFWELLKSIDDLKNTNFIFTKTNSDLNGKAINLMIDEYVEKNSYRSAVYTSLGQLKYLSAFKHVDAVVGNSSSGIIEAPSFKIATINIGDRQKGRVKADSIIDCLPNKENLKKTFKLIYSNDFKKNLKKVKNPYDKGNSSSKIVKILKNIDLENILKKNFYSIKF